jgi:hypothetical protein
MFSKLPFVFIHTATLHRLNGCRNSELRRTLRDDLSELFAEEHKSSFFV